MEIIVEHYPNCNAKYPEKIEGEKPQEIMMLDVDGATIYQCVDCGAYVIANGDIEDEDNDDDWSEA